MSEQTGNIRRVVMRSAILRVIDENSEGLSTADILAVLGEVVTLEANTHEDCMEAPPDDGPLLPCPHGERVGLRLAAHRLFRAVRQAVAELRQIWGEEHPDNRHCGHVW
jgi:hypothetical protein